MSKRKDPLLVQYSQRCQAIRDQVHHLIHNQDTYGLYIWGPRGCGKTTGLDRALKEMNITPALYRGASSAEGLFEVMKANRSAKSVIWMNDDPRILKDPKAQQYLMPGLDPITNPHTKEPYRPITKVRANATSDTFEFRGRFVFDCNVSLTANRAAQVLQAVADRLMIAPFGPDNAELGAVIKYLARQEGIKSAPIFSAKNPEYPHIIMKSEDFIYWKSTTPAQRLEIGTFVMAEAQSRKKDLSLRLFRDTVRWLYSQEKYGYQTDWRDFVIKNLTEHDVEYKYSRKDQRLEKERQDLIEAIEDAYDLWKSGGKMHKHDVCERWCLGEGRAKPQFHRRLAEMPEDVRRLYNVLPDKRWK